MPSSASFVKTHATTLAYDTREELGLKPWDRLDPLVLADYLAIPVQPLSDLRALNAQAADQFLQVESGAFSAVTTFRGTARRIIHNDAHSPGRQASNICHELAHGLLLHEPAPALDDSGCRNWDQLMEEQAEWVGGALLVHELGLVTSLRRGSTIPQLARQYGVSQDMIRYRINVTGARRRAGKAS